VPDITRLILDEHERFRRGFADLDDLRDRRSVGPDELAAVWNPLAQRLEVHAVAEEDIFYPQLLRKGEDPEAETLDAIRDHNAIRDAVHDASRHPVGGEAWWEAVDRARLANDDHMAEEEREALADFRRNATSGLRESLGRRFAAFVAEHESTHGLDTSDKDPEGYVREVERELESSSEASRMPDGSLGIGNLKGR